MWATATPKDRQERENPWHNPQHHEGDESKERESGEHTPDSPGALHEGRWGERDAGVRSREAALEEFQSLREELTHRRSQSRGRTNSLRRVTSGRSAKSVRSARSRGSVGGNLTRQISSRRSRIEDEEAQGVEEAEEAEEAESDVEAQEAELEEEFELDQFLRDGRLEKRTADGRSAKKVGVVWRNLTVKGVGATATKVKTFPDAVIGTFGPDLYRITTRFFPKLSFSRKQQTRTLINDFNGVLRDGEMILVLGRPGSGCTTFLKAISNNRESYAAVEGEVSYGGIPAEKQKKRLRGEVNYNPEDDRHFASLNVWQTLKFALMNKTKKKEMAELPIIIQALLAIFGVTHTKYTLVGDEYTRGVSGGERKRVSIMETLATKSTVVCWDNSTRGLDSSTALDYAKSLRIMTDISNRTTLVTLYQAGEAIYDLMDKVMVIDEGRCVFLGPARDARQYFIDLGYECPPRQTTPDFLTSVTDPAERQFRKGFENRAPRSPEDLEKAFRSSTNYQLVLDDVAAYEKELRETDYADAKQLEETVQEQKNKRVSKKSVYTVSFPQQVLACAEREFWLLLGDATTLWTKFFIIISNGLIVGSLFYGQSLNTEGTFSRGGSLFFSIVFLGWLQLTELMKAVSGRVVVARHKDYGMYRPSAVVLARVLTDIPVLLVQVIIFGVIMYFMTGLDVDVSKFWIYMLFVYTTTLCITALYRAFASLSPTIDDAVRFSGLSLNILVIFTGYVIPKTQLIGDYIWFGWLYYINPLGYAFEAVVANEFSDRTMQCSEQQLVPQGPNVNTANQGCALRGAPVNGRTVSGAAYLEQTYTYERSHLWRNFGVIIAFTVLYILVTALATELVSFAGSGGGALIFKGSRKANKAMQEQPPADEEKATGGEVAVGSSTTSSSNTLHNVATQKEQDTLDKLAMSDSVFTWKDVEFTVPYRGGERKLLNKISGYAKPGKMVALMGASGAGKTTLLNTLSQRQSVGVVSGSMLVDGKALPNDFQRSTGFCEQMDLHDGTATIREALEFSALLRQDAEVPRAEKIEYVDRVIELLELEDIQDALIMSLGVEQRKRLTIGVELAAKPSLLLFLDEPTSGLDSNSAYSIVRFLKKLSAAGQAIVCTIHQPSSILVQQFDMILALNPGGNVFYFGPVGENGKDVVKYFADRGVECPPTRNIAEFILETAIKSPRVKGRRIDWNAEWRKSDNQKEVLAEIDRIHAERQQKISDSGDGHDGKSTREFAAPTWLQTTLLTKRVFLQHWRDPSYLYGKLFISVIMGIFNGFTFYSLGNSIQDMQDRMFSSFLIIVFPPTIVNAVVPKFYQNMALWQARELPSRIYGWIPFTTAMVVTEIPAAIVGAVVYYLLWYFPTGLPRDSSTAGYVFLMVVLFFLFQASWGQWICAFAPSFTVISNVLPFFFVMFSLFNGVVRPYSMLPVFWKYWMYYINPSTWWIAGVMSATLHNTPVRCANQEFAKFTAPAGESCESYAGAFADQSGGYVQTLQDGVCGFCQFRSGNEYMASLNVQPSDKWPDLGYFIVFVISNYFLVYFFVYTVRIKGWSFGFGYVFGGLGKLLQVTKGLFRRRA